MGGPGSGGARPSAKAAERRARAVEMRLAGATYSQIAQRLEYSSAGSAHKAVQSGLDRDHESRRKDEIATELARLDSLLLALWPKARGGDVQAVDRVLKIGERRAQILSHGISLADEVIVEPEGNPLDEFTRRLRDRQASPGDHRHPA